MLVEYDRKPEKIELIALPQILKLLIALPIYSINLIEVRQPSPYILLELDLLDFLKNVILPSSALLDDLNEVSLLLELKIDSQADVL